MDNLILRELTLEDQSAFTRACLIPAESDVIFALGYQPAMTYLEYLSSLKKLKDGIDLPDGYVPSTMLFGFVGKEIIGRLSLRHALNPFLEKVGGHIGYLTLPPHQKKGYASNMLKQSLVMAKALGLTNVLLTCDEDNVGSIKTIEKNHGVFENTYIGENGQKNKRRYWINL